jgi:hypothetical protein
MDEETKKSLDNVVRQLQSRVCVEYAKYGTPNKDEIVGYLLPILLINQEFRTNYSMDIKKFKPIDSITKLPLID